MESYRFIDHTADAGIEAFGRTMAEAYANAFRGLQALLIDPETVGSPESRGLDVEGLDREDLLVRWLSEILYLVGVKRWIPAEAHIGSCDAQRLHAEEGNEQP